MPIKYLLPTDFIPRPLTPVTRDDTTDAVNRLLEEYLASSADGRFETLRLDRNGRRAEVSLTVSPLEDGAGGILGVSQVARDSSEPKRLKRRLP